MEDQEEIEEEGHRRISLDIQNIQNTEENST